MGPGVGFDVAARAEGLEGAQSRSRLERAGWPCFAGAPRVRVRVGVRVRVRVSVRARARVRVRVRVRVTLALSLSAPTELLPRAA